MPYAKRVHLLPRKTIHILAGPPVDLDDLRGQPITARCSSRRPGGSSRDITELLEQLRGEQAPAEVYDPRKHDGPRIGNPAKAARAHTGEGEAMTRCAVLGTGSWGTAFALVLADAGCEVTMWGRRAELTEQITTDAPQRRLPAGHRAAGVDRRHHRRRRRRCGTPTSSSSRCRRRRSASTSCGGPT